MAHLRWGAAGRGLGSSYDRLCRDIDRLYEELLNTAVDPALLHRTVETSRRQNVRAGGGGPDHGRQAGQQRPLPLPADRPDGENALLHCTALHCTPSSGALNCHTYRDRLAWFALDQGVWLLILSLHLLIDLEKNKKDFNGASSSQEVLLRSTSRLPVLVLSLLYQTEYKDRFSPLNMY